MTKHNVTVDRVQAACCDNPTHTRFEARCDCGWESVNHVERVDAGAAIQGHRIAVLEAAAGIRFKVEWAR